MVLENVQVNLYDASAGTLEQTEYTDPFGRYLFQSIPSGDYYVEFVAPPLMTFVNPNLGADNTTDSDATPDPFDPRIGVSHIITVSSGTVDLTIDAGLEMSVVLAIDDLKLEAYRDEDKNINVVEWFTSQEVDSDFFAIERSIDSTNDWEEIGLENAAGNSSQELEYFYNDNDMRGTGTYYYRLRVVDIDGSFTYSDIVAVDVEDSRVDNQVVKLDVYPNPVLNQINIDLETEYDSSIDGGIYDAIGQVIKKVDKSSVSAGMTNIRMDVSDLPAGTYLIRMQVGKQVIFEKITKAE